MKNIFFCSFMVKAKDHFKDYIKNFEAKEILFIPTASHKEPHRDYCYRVWSIFEDLGFRVRDLEVDMID